MFDVHLTTIKVIDIENNKVVIDSTFGEKEYVLDKGATLGSIIIMLYIQRFLIHYLH